MNGKLKANLQWLDGKVSGKSVKYNQLIDYTTFTTQTANGITFTNNNDGTITINGTATADVYRGFDITSTYAIEGHKYFMFGCPVGGSDSTYYLGNGFGFTDIGSGLFITATQSVLARYIRIYVKSGVTVNNVVFKPQDIDLTTLFGAGNEPTTLADFYLTDIGKLVQAGVYLPYSTGGILSATSPFAFKDSNNNTLTTYNPSPALTLRAVGKELKSLLGKQNVQTTGNNRRVFAKNDNSFLYNNTNQNSKPFNLINAHKYFVLWNIETQVSGFIGTTSPAQFFSNGTLTGLGNATLSNVGTNMYVSIITASGTDVANLSYYNNGTGGESTTKYAIVIDLTAIGLDNLTAQQFYDNYNQYFEKLADGQTINTLCDTLWNCSGNVERKLGIVKLKDINWVYDSGGNKFYKSVSGIYINSSLSALPNILCPKYTSASQTTMDGGINNIISTHGGIVYIRDTNYTDATTFKNHFTDDDVLIFELATPTTEQHPSIAIPKLATKCTDANGMEIDIERNN